MFIVVQGLTNDPTDRSTVVQATAANVLLLCSCGYFLLSPPLERARPPLRSPGTLTAAPILSFLSQVGQRSGRERRARGRGGRRANPDEFQGPQRLGVRRAVSE